ncbi:MAG: ABC transporter ATP-binding protein [Bifidobacteriaceae bacterium]|jgi:ABC-2 type transport system ATP-binding protein|nr:ABC transporter ATP-binding protein [Bifidobacteriaceae bacterium]
MKLFGKTMTPDPEVVVDIQNLQKLFKLHHNYSLKDSFVNLFTRSNIHKTMFTALNDINLQVHRGEAVGLIGRNGSGKSTLLKQITGVQRPDAGSVRVKGKMAGLIEVGAGFHPDLTGRENIYLNGAILGMSKNEIEQKFDEIVEFSGQAKFIDTEVRFYSSGMYMRLAFSVAIHTEPDLFLVDEVLSVGDNEFRKKCIQKLFELKNENRTFMIVSHSENQIRQICDRVVWLHHGIIMADGTPDEVYPKMNAFQS